MIGTVDNNYKGLVVYPIHSAANVRNKPSIKSDLLLHVLKGKPVGIATGTYFKMPDANWFQVSTEKGNGYVQQKIVSFEKPKTTTPAKPQNSQTITEDQANDMVSKLVESDKKIFETLLRISPIISTAKSKGKNTAEFEAKFKALTDRLSARQEAIKNSKVVSWSAGIKKGYDKMISWFKDFYSSISGIGEPISITTGIIISAVVGAGLATTAYFMFKPKYSESQVDLKISSELEALLQKTDPETAEKIKENLEGQIDKAYNQGKTDQSFTSMWNIGKYVLIFGAGYFLITKFVNTQRSKA